MTPRALQTDYPRRGLSRERAAAWVGVSATKFDEMVKDGRMPGPKVIDARIVWDRYRLDEAFEALPDRDQAATNDDWRAAI
jgi:predicted DNA-binding transcriptional regulator AlpA